MPSNSSGASAWRLLRPLNADPAFAEDPSPSSLDGAKERLFGGLPLLLGVDDAWETWSDNRLVANLSSYGGAVVMLFGGLPLLFGVGDACETWSEDKLGANPRSPSGAVARFFGGLPLLGVGVPMPLEGSADGLFGGLPLLLGVGVTCETGSDRGSGSLAVFGRFGVRRIGVPARLFFAALGIGVPFVFLGLPLFLGVDRPSPVPCPYSSSMDSFSGTVVVVALNLGLLVVA
jgi:hypothetical protein